MFSLAEALIKELTRGLMQGYLAARYYPHDSRGTPVGSHLCATCERTISANKHQCASCADMTDLAVLVIARSSREADTPLNPEAEARITELRLKYLRDKVRLAHFVYRLVHAAHPAETTTEAVDEFVIRLLVEGR